MVSISRGTKVQVEVGGRWIPGVVLSHHFASDETYDLYMLRVAEYSQVTQRWQVSSYGPVQSRRLMRRETVVPELDQEEKSHSESVPRWVEQLEV